MWVKILLISALVLLMGSATFLVMRWYDFTRSSDSLRSALVERSLRPYLRINEETLNRLPDPVERYLRYSLPGGYPDIRIARVEQEGHLRLNKAADKWQRFRAGQIFTLQPPGFIWEASVRMLPLINTKVVDRYQEGEGSINARLLGAIKVVYVSGQKELAEAGLQRYLAESVWFPPALLPRDNLEWLPIDHKKARAVIYDKGFMTWVDFEFNERGEIIKASSERYRMVGKSFESTRWSVYYKNYSEIQGMRLPLKAVVEWNLPNEDFDYCRAHVTSITFE